MARQKLSLRKRAPNTKGSIKTTTKTKVETKVKTVVRSKADPVDAVVIAVSKTPREKAESRIKFLNDDRSKNYVHIGGLLARVRDEKWYSEPTFGEYVIKRFAWTPRTALAMIQAFETVNRLGLHWRDLKGIGWSKFRLVAALMDERNKRRWLKIARKSTMTALEAKTKKARAAKAGVPGAAEPGASEPVTTMRFALHRDQKRTADRAISEAMRLSDTEHPSVAFDYIMQSFLATVGLEQHKPARLQDVLVRVASEMTPEDALRYVQRAVRKVFPAVGVKLKSGVGKQLKKRPPKKKASKKKVVKKVRREHSTHAEETAEAA